MIACSGVIWSLTTQSGLCSGRGFGLGGPAMVFENFSPVVFAPRLNEELCHLFEPPSWLERSDYSQKALRKPFLGRPLRCSLGQQWFRSLGTCYLGIKNGLSYVRTVLMDTNNPAGDLPPSATLLWQGLQNLDWLTSMNDAVWVELGQSRCALTPSCNEVTEQIDVLALA